MFGRAGKIRRAVERTVQNALAGSGDDVYAPIDALRDHEKVEALVDVCHKLIFEENLTAAGAAVDRALELAPEELYVLDSKAQVAVEADRVPDAIATYRRMHELAPTDPAVLTGLADLLLRTGDAAGAVALLEPHADSPEAELQLKLGEALYAADRADQALELLGHVRAHYASALKRASFVDNPQEIRRHFDAANRLYTTVHADLAGDRDSD